MLRASELFGKDNRAVAATEFALIFPLLAFAMFAEFEYYRFAMTTQRLEIVANSIAQMIGATGAGNGAKSPVNGTIDDNLLALAVNGMPFLYPDGMVANPGFQIWKIIEVDAAAIDMRPQQDGTFKPFTAWHSKMASGAYSRPCGVELKGVPSNSTPSPTTLPVDMIGLNPLIVVDVHTTYAPTFGASFVPPIPIARSVYLSPRNVTAVEYNGGNIYASNCT